MLRQIFAGVLLAGFLALCFGYHGDYQSMAAVELLANSKSEKMRAVGTHRKLVTRAIGAEPLGQNNIAAAAIISVMPDAPRSARWTAYLGKLGWRSTPAMQLLIMDALNRKDLGGIVNITDALLRREKLVDQASALMALVESDEAGWKQFYPTIAQNPPWRSRYLGTATILSNEAMIKGRLRTLVKLQRSGEKLSRQEVAPFVQLLVRRGDDEDAKLVWTNFSRSKALLADPEFSVAAEAVIDPTFAVPFEWNFADSVDVSPDGIGGADVIIRWDGRGVPVFLRQRVGPIGKGPSLEISTGSDALLVMNRIGFRLACPKGSADFELRRSLKANVIQGKLEKPVICDYPELQVYGKVQDRRVASEVVLQSIDIRRDSTK